MLFYLLPQRSVEAEIAVDWQVSMSAVSLTCESSERLASLAELDLQRRDDEVLLAFL